MTMSGEDERCLAGCYRDIARPAYLQVEADHVSWHEGGRDTYHKLKIEEGVFKPAGEVMREVTGIDNYNFKMTIGGRLR